MTDVHALHSRLASVNHRLVSSSHIKDVYRQGASLFSDAPADGIVQTVSLSRANPILGTAFALGAYQSSTPSQNLSLNKHADMALGIALCRWGYFAEALPLLAQPTDADVRERHSLDLITEWHAILCRRRIRPLPDASDQLIEIATQLETEGNLTAAMQCRQDAASMHYLPSRDGKIEQVLDAVQGYFKEHDLIGDLGICLVIMVFTCLNQGNFEGAHEMLDEAERLFVTARMPTLLSYTWQVRGQIYLAQRQMKKARHWTDRACSYAAGLRHEYYLSLCLFTQFTICYETGDLNTCGSILQTLQSLSSAQQLTYVRADTAFLAGNLALRLGRYDDAEACYSRAEQVYTDTNQQVGDAICRMALGIVARRKGDFGRSLRLLEGSLASLLSEHSFVNSALAHHNLAKTYAAFGYFEPAIEHAQKGIRLLRDNQAEQQTVKPAIYLARLLAERAQVEEAHRLLDSVSRFAAQADLTLDYANAEQVRALALRRTGQLGEALAAYQRSLSLLAPLRQKEGIRETLVGIAETHGELGDVRQAAASLHRLRRSRLPAHLRWRYDWMAAKIAAQHHRPVAALAAYRSALAQARDSRRTLEQEEQTEPFALALQPLYEEAFALALANNQPALALAFTEMHGSQLLSVRLGRTVGLADDPQDIPARLIDHLCAREGRGWTVLRYAWSQEAVWMFALTPEGVQTYHIPLDVEQTAALQVCACPDDSYREFAYGGRFRTQRNAPEQGREARRLLLEALIPEPIRNRLSPDHLLVIIPTYQLHGLPFHALLDGTAPLIDRARIIYAHSLDLLYESLEGHVEMTSGLRQGLICGQSRFRHPQYKPLPYIADEIHAISAAAPITPDCLVNDQLTGSALLDLAHSGRLASYDWLHFSTHAHYDVATGAFTGLLLGQDTVEIGEILTWHIKARLVTLSACQTGFGKWYYGDEIAGLVQALLGAGAQTVVASLWLARERHIPGLMADFYGGMAQGHPPSFALAEAQRSAHRNGVDAYDWASWTVFGHS